MLHLVLERLEKLEHLQREIERMIMALFDTLTQSLTDLGTSMTALTGSVDAAVTELGTLPPTDAQIAALTTVVTGLTAATNGLSARLNAAVTPPPAPTPPAA